MPTFITLLRGINVSGQKKIRMEDLKVLMEEMEFTGVRTYIQSGNVVFTTQRTDRKNLVEKISGKIKDHYGFEVKILVKTTGELEKVIRENPFQDLDGKKPDKIYITFLSGVPSGENIKKIEESHFKGEEYRLKGDIVYFVTTGSYGKAKMNNNFFESKLKVFATTRNWQTVNVLWQMARETGKSI
jgi:uncharacterized protein (DUF1697 family)